MSVPLAPFGDRREAPAEPLARRSDMHCELPSPAACANVHTIGISGLSRVSLARDGGSVTRADRMGFLNRESGRIAIAVPFQTSRVIPLMLRVSQSLDFGGTQF